MTTRSKFRLTSIHDHGYSKTYYFQTQYDRTIPEDQSFSKATPNGKIEMVIDNPVAQARFEIGKDYYFDALPVPA